MYVNNNNGYIRYNIMQCLYTCLRTKISNNYYNSRSNMELSTKLIQVHGIPPCRLCTRSLFLDPHKRNRCSGSVVWFQLRPDPLQLKLKMKKYSNEIYI